MISGNSIIVTASDQLCTNLGEEVVILNISSGVYHGLDGVGSRAWQLMQEEKTVNEICEVIASEYDVGAEQCQNDLIALIDELVNAGLVKVKDEARAPVSQL
jgi:hypothetical protein